MRAGLVVETLTHLALALTTEPAVAFAVMFVFGFHAFVWGTTSRTIRQRSVPVELQGRVGSVYLIGVYGGMLVGAPDRRTAGARVGRRGAVLVRLRRLRAARGAALAGAGPRRPRPRPRARAADRPRPGVTGATSPSGFAVGSAWDAGDMEITRSVETTTPIEKVFAYLSDFTNTEEWDPGTVSTRRVAGDGGVGHEVRQRLEVRRQQDRADLHRAHPRAQRALRPGRSEQDRHGHRHHDLQPHRRPAPASPTTPPSSSRGSSARSPRCCRRCSGIAFKKLGDEAEKGLQTNLDKLGK